MNHPASHRSSRIPKMLLSGALLASAFIGAVVPQLGRAQTPPAADNAAQTAKSKAAVGVDALIAHLHESLKIMPAQESQFQKLADVMRENAETMSVLAKKRAEGAGKMTAVDDLKSYAEISQAHADGTQKMVPAFQSLYDSMSDDQKKIADQEFREHYTTHHHHKKA